VNFENLLPSYSKTDPDSECAYSTLMALGRSAKAVYFHHKSADAQETGAKNEDTIAWQVDPSGEIVSFAVCDGVGGSYLGYFASNYLAAMLVSTLNHWGTNVSKGRIPDDGLTASTLRERLDSSKDAGRVGLERQQISADNNPMLVEVLKNRERSGSHAVFFCGYIDCRAGGESLFAWMGNVRGQVFGMDGHGLLDASTMADDRVRWTTTHGCQGAPNLKRIPTVMIRRILVFSDGLEKIADRLTSVQNVSEDTELVRSLTGMSVAEVFGDDASLLSIWPSAELNTQRDELEGTDSGRVDAVQADLPVWEQKRRFARIWGRIVSRRRRPS
jgi:hypothetical protein